MEEPINFVDNNLESFFSQLANPFVDQEIVASQMFPLYKEGLPSEPKKEKELKRPLPDSPSPSSDDGSKDGETAATKQKNRRVNQNIASRNYRNRKKEYVHSLESKVSQLSAENDALKKEISFLKRVDNFDSMRPDPSLISMVVELRQIMSSMMDAIKKNADDSTISYLLQLFHLVVEKRHHIFEKEVEKLVNPFAQAKLAILGYTPVLEYPAVANVISPNQDGWWNQYMVEAKISPSQMQKIHLMREELWKIDQELRQERVSLDASIKEFYLHKMRVIPNYPAVQEPLVPTPEAGKESGVPSSDSPVDVSDAIELSRKMNLLKKNFVTQRNLMINAFSRLGQLLSPRQQAQLLLKLQIQTRFDSVNMELLKNVWESVTSSEAPMNQLLSMIPGNKEPSSTGSPLTTSSSSPSLPSTTTFGASPPLSSVPISLPRHPLTAAGALPAHMLAQAAASRAFPQGSPPQGSAPGPSQVTLSPSMNVVNVGPRHPLSNVHLFPTQQPQ